YILHWNSFDLSFYYDFLHFYTSVQSYHTNGFGRVIKILKIILNDAFDKNIHNNTSYKHKNFKVLTEEVNNIYLSEDELQRIICLDLSFNPTIQSVRDTFIIGCYTGLRFSDISKINKQQNDTIYMHKMDSTSNAYFNKGIMFGIDELATDFKVYEKVAWSKKQYGAYRCNYYILLLNNAYSASKWGSAIYYAEKAKKQGEIDNYPRLFIDFTVKMSIYSNTGEVERIIKTYEENQNTIEHFGSKIAEKPEKYYMEGRDLLPIFDLVINSYYNNDDTLKAEKVHQIANSVVKSMNKATTYTEEYKQYNDFYLLSFAFRKAHYHKQNQEALHILNKMKAKVEKQQQIDYLTYDVIRNKADLFLEM